MENLERTDAHKLIAERYELGGEVGRGATGTVWEAWDRRTSRAVAIKILHPHLLTSGLTRRRFLREVELASTLRHPHCVEVLAHGDVEPRGAFLVMERLHGTTLAKRLREGGPLPQHVAVRIVAQVLDAVGAAHAAKIVHRDLKPANVMLIERDGDCDFVKVCDFGLAKAIVVEPSTGEDQNGDLVEVGSLSTNQSEICGTPEYIAPEQARGETIDGRADLYSVGVILYQALIGRPPFQGRNVLGVVSMHLTSPPPRPSELRPDLRIYPPLEKLVLRALLKERAERPSSAEVFRADLLQIGRDLARHERQARKAGHDLAPATLSGKASWWSTRRIAVGAVGLALVGATFAGWRLRSRTGGWAGTAVAAVRPSSSPLPSPPSLPDAPSPVALTPRPPATSEARPARQPPRSRPDRHKPPSDDPSEAMIRAAEDRLAAGQIVEACGLAQSAVEANPKSPTGWRFLGRCRMRRGEREAALAAFRRYLELAPEAPDATYVRAILDEKP
jgi:serine/threonine-protein kinase